MCLTKTGTDNGVSGRRWVGSSGSRAVRFVFTDYQVGTRKHSLVAGMAVTCILISSIIIMNEM